MEGSANAGSPKKKKKRMQLTSISREEAYKKQDSEPNSRTSQTSDPGLVYQFEKSQKRQNDVLEDIFRRYENMEPVDDDDIENDVDDEELAEKRRQKRNKRDKVNEYAKLMEAGYPEELKNGTPLRYLIMWKTNQPGPPDTVSYQEERINKMRTKRDTMKATLAEIKKTMMKLQVAHDALANANVPGIDKQGSTTRALLGDIKELQVQEKRTKSQLNELANDLEWNRDVRLADIKRNDEAKLWNAIDVLLADPDLLESVQAKLTERRGMGLSSNILADITVGLSGYHIA